jgi:hypothetical protein
LLRRIGFGAPWGGLIASPDDFARFCQMMLNGGALGDVRILSPATVRALTMNQLASMPQVPEEERRCRPWGLGWRLNWPNHPANLRSLGRNRNDVLDRSRRRGVLPPLHHPATGTREPVSRAHLQHRECRDRMNPLLIGSPERAYAIKKADLIYYKIWTHYSLESRLIRRFAMANRASVDSAIR